MILAIGAALMLASFLGAVRERRGGRDLEHDLYAVGFFTGALLIVAWLVTLIAGKAVA